MTELTERPRMTGVAGNTLENAESIPPESPFGDPLPKKQSVLRRFAVPAAGVLLFTLTVSAYHFWNVYFNLESARKSAQKRDWTDVRDRVSNFLTYNPQDSEALLMMAEAIVKQNSGDPKNSALQAIQFLRRIDNDSPMAAKARMQEARLTLLILKQPGLAETLLRTCLQMAPDSYDANLLMWKVLDLTGRHVLSRDYFWRVYELSPDYRHPELLRDWYLAEFYPDAANQSFYEAIGAAELGKVPASISLLVIFNQSEPQASFLNAALADYYLGNGRPKSSLELLKEAPDLQQAMKDPFFVSVLFESLLELGELEKAEACFRNFPEPHKDYLYWKTEGLYNQRVQDNAAAAVTSYERALSSWPAKFDWGLMMRLAECLRKVGRGPDAEELQARVKYLTTEVLTLERTSRIRQRLSSLADPDVAEEVRDLYQEFGLKMEAEAWESVRRSLIRESQAAAADGNSPDNL